MKKLSEDLRKALKLQLKRTRDIHERNRLCVILARDDGHSPDVIANILHLSRESIFIYLREYDNREKTRHLPKGGRKSKLSIEQIKSLLDHLEKVTYGKSSLIVAYIERTFGVFYSTKGLVHLLKRHGFVYKKPIKVPTNLCPIKQEAFIQKYEDLKKNLNKDEEIYFIDSVHPEYQSQAAFGWIKQGTQKTLKTTAKQERVHLMGALKLDGIKILTKQYDTIKKEHALDFIKTIEESSNASKIHIILDNAPYYRSIMLREYAEKSRVCLHFLPSYSPNLNPIERVWKILRENVTYNKYYKRFQDFTERIEFFFENLSLVENTLKSRINDNFQRIKLNPVQLPGPC